MAAVSHVLESTSKQWMNVMQKIIKTSKVREVTWIPMLVDYTLTIRW